MLQNFTEEMKIFEMPVTVLSNVVSSDETENLIGLELEVTTLCVCGTGSRYIVWIWKW